MYKMLEINIKKLEEKLIKYIFLIRLKKLII